MPKNNEINTLIESIDQRLLDGRIIGIDKFHADDYIQAGLITSEFVDYFRDYPYSEDNTNKYDWTIRRVDQLINLRIWRISDYEQQTIRSIWQSNPLISGNPSND